MDVKKAIEKDPLYTEYEFSYENIEALSYYDESVDLYCPYCEKESVFSIELSAKQQRTHNIPEGTVPLPPENKRIHIKMYCSRNNEHIASSLFIGTGDKIIKVGQYPSSRDKKGENLSRFRKHFEADYKELNRAYGLSDYEVGVASMVYLRRIFERALKRAEERRKKQDKDWNPETISNDNISDKIKELKGYLPQFIVDNKTAYSILSKSIHELNETDCLEHFSLLAESIELILDQEIELIKKEDHEDKLSKQLNKRNSELS